MFDEINPAWVVGTEVVNVDAITGSMLAVFHFDATLKLSFLHSNYYIF